MLRNAVHALFGRARTVRLVGIALLAGLVALRIWDPVPVEVLRLKGFDILQRLSPNLNPSRPARIVDIDEESLTAHGQWPWPRTLVARLIENIVKANALVIGVDIIFAEEDRTSPKNFAAYVDGLDADTLAKLEKLPSNDAVLADALRRAGRVVLGQSGYHRDLGRGHAEVKGPPLATLGGDPRPYMLRYPDLLQNVPLLHQAASSRGILTVNPDVDGIVRRVPLVVIARDAVFATLSVEMLRVVGGFRPLVIRTDEARHRQRRGIGHHHPHRPAGAAVGALFQERPGALRLGQRHHRGRPAGDEAHRALRGADRDIRARAVRHQGNTARPGDAREWKCTPSSSRTSSPANTSTGPIIP